MNLNADLFEQINFHPAIFPVDSQSGANNGLWVSMKGYNKCAIIVYKGLGTAGDDVVFTLKQATAVAGTSAKALNIDRIWSKLHATTVPGLPTLVTQTAAATYTDDTSAEKKGWLGVDIFADDLDVNNNFDCIQLSVPDTGAAGADLLCGLYMLYGARYAGNNGAAFVSPLVD